MASYFPPTEDLPIFDNEVFDASNSDAQTLTIAKANLLYLRKTIADTATALETFNAGILSSSIDSLTPTSDMTIGPSMTTSTLNIGNAITSGNINIGISDGRNNIIHIGDGNSLPIGNSVHINNGTPNASSTVINNGASSSGSVNIMTGTTTTGTINMCTAIGAGNTSKVNISNGSTTGLVSIGNSGNSVTVNANILNLGTSTKTMNANCPITLTYSPSEITGTNDLGYKINGTALATTLTGSAPNDLYQVSLTVGVWLIQANVRYATPGTFINLSISASSLTFDQNATVLVSTAGITAPIQQVSRIVSITSGTPTWYLVSGCQTGTVVTNVVFNVYRIA